MFSRCLLSSALVMNKLSYLKKKSSPAKNKTKQRDKRVIMCTHNTLRALVGKIKLSQECKSILKVIWEKQDGSPQLPDISQITTSAGFCPERCTLIISIQISSKEQGQPLAHTCRRCGSHDMMHVFASQLVLRQLIIFSLLLLKV